MKLPLAGALVAGTLALASHVPSWNPSLMSSGVYMYVRFVLDLDR